MLVFALVGAVVAETPSDGPAAASVDLRPNFRAGRAASYRFWTQRQTEHRRTFAGRSSSISSRYVIEGVLGWTVDDVHDDGSATCTMKIEWMKWTITMPDGSNRTNDSREQPAEDDPRHQLLIAMTATPLEYEVAVDGMVNSVSGTDAIREAVDQPARVPHDLDFIESAADLAVLVAAPEKIEPGGRWEVPLSWTHDFGLMHHQMTFTLSSLETLAGIPVATVSGTSEMSLEVDASKLPQNGPEVEVELLDASLEVQIMYDLARHEAVGRNSIENRTVRISAEVSGRSAVTVGKERIQSQVLRISED